MIERFNYKHNEALEKNFDDRLINGQGVGNVSAFRYGLFPMSYNGCEIIAVYNLCKKISFPCKLCDAACEIYPYGSLLSGLFGTNPHALSRWFRENDIDMVKTDSCLKFEKLLKKNKYGVFSFWTGKAFMSSLHTVMAEYDGQNFIIYNASNRQTVPSEFKNIADCVKNSKRFITGYIYMN